MPTGRRVFVPIVSALALGLLIGCASTSTAGPRVPTTSASTPTPTPTPTLEPPTDLSSRFSFDCDDVAPAIAGLHGAAIPLTSTFPTVEGGATWLAGPGQRTFGQAGDVYCEFGDPMDMEGANAKVIFVAEGAAAMADRVATIGEYSGPSCSFDTRGGNCSSLELVGDAYVELHAMGVVGAEANAAEQELTTAAEALKSLVADGVGPSSWIAPAGTSPLGPDCEAILSAEELAALVGVDALAIQHPEGGWSIEGWMLAGMWSADPCQYFEGLDAWSGPMHGQLTWLQGGEQAYEQNTGGEPLDVGEGADRAVLDCSGTGYYPCAVDILAGRNWIRYAIFDTGDDASTRPALATAVAQAVIDNVRG